MKSIAATQNELQELANNGASTSAQPKAVLSALTGLRFVAAMHVVVYHYFKHLLSMAPIPMQNLGRAGWIGVDIFFVLSGFVLAYNYINDREINTREFWIARFARIYPAYLFAWILTAPCYLYLRFAIYTPIVALGRSVPVAILSLCLLQAWLPSPAGGWNGPAWSISVEAVFYLLFPVFAPYIRRLTTNSLILAIFVLWILFIGSPIVARQFFFQGAWSNVISFNFNPIFRLPEFLIGAFLGRLYVRSHLRIWQLRFCGKLANIAVLGLLLLLSVGTMDSSILVSILVGGVQILLIALIIYGLAHGTGLVASMLSSRVIVALGAASYGIYIFQEPVAIFMKYISDGRLDHNFKTSLFVKSPAYLFCYVILLVSISLASHRWIEAPANRAIKRAFTSFAHSSTARR